MREWRERQASRVVEHVFPRRVGSIAPRVPSPESRHINVSGELWGDTEAALRTTLEDIRHTLNDIGRDRLILWDDNRYLNAVKESFDFAFATQKSPPNRRADINIGFLADDPYWYAPTPSVASASLTGSGIFAVTNNGKARTPPVIEIIRFSLGTEIPDVLLTNTTTGLFAKWVGTFIVGNKLVFDMVNRRVLMAGGLALNSSLGSFNMNLEPGLNNFSYIGPGNVLITTTWTERWS